MVKKIFELPNPEANRLPCVDGCLSAVLKENKEKPDLTISRPDCDKIFECADGKKVCIAYLSPERIWSKGDCALASNKVNIQDELKKKLNPIKASKRGNR